MVVAGVLKEQMKLLLERGMKGSRVLCCQEMKKERRLKGLVGDPVVLLIGLLRL